MTYQFNDPKTAHRKDQHMGDYLAWVCAGKEGEYPGDLDALVRVLGGYVKPRGERWDDDATNLRQMALACLPALRLDGDGQARRTLESLFESQYLVDDGMRSHLFKLGLRGRSEGRSIEYVDHVHRAWLACILRPDIYGEALGKHARDLLWQDLTLYALCMTPEGKVLTPSGRVYNADGVVPEGLSHVLSVLLNLSYRRKRDQWWERRHSYTPQIWGANHGKLAIFSDSEVGALRLWILKRRMTPALRDLLAPIRLATGLTIAAGNPWHHVAWYDDTRGWYLSGDSKAQMIAWSGGSWLHGFQVTESTARVVQDPEAYDLLYVEERDDGGWRTSDHRPVGLDEMWQHIRFDPFREARFNGSNGLEVPVGPPAPELPLPTATPAVGASMLRTVRARLAEPRSDDHPLDALLDVHAYLEKHLFV